MFLESQDACFMPSHPLNNVGHSKLSVVVLPAPFFTTRTSSQLLGAARPQNLPKKLPRPQMKLFCKPTVRSILREKKVSASVKCKH